MCCSGQPCWRILPAAALDNGWQAFCLGNQKWRQMASNVCGDSRFFELKEFAAKEQSMLILFMFVEKKNNLSFDVPGAGFQHRFTSKAC
jgi:hypothetical protein